MKMFFLVTCCEPLASAPVILQDARASWVSGYKGQAFSHGTGPG